MSSCPGVTLEDWLTDWFGIVVNGNQEYGDSIRQLYTNQLVLSTKQFKLLTDLFAPVREHVELWCRRYNEEENGSWRDYCSVFEIPEDISKQAEQYLQRLLELKEITLTKGI